MKAFDILSFHPGRQHNLEQAVQLHKTFKNFRHATSFYFDKKAVQASERFSTKLSAGLKKRSSELNAQVVDTYPIPEARLLMKRILGHQLSIGDYINRNKAFQEWMLRTYAPPKTCIGFDTASWLIFEKWKNKSFLILDLSIAAPQYKRKLAKEHNLDEAVMANQTKDDAAVYDIYAKELELADFVLCGSSFVKESCLALGVDAAKLHVIPYGADLSTFHADEPAAQSVGKIKVAFNGSINYRKGADILLKAWQQISKNLSNIELHFYGNVQIELPPVTGVFYHGFKNQGDLISELRTAHISVLPTFFEGSSLAIYQSMAMGLAAITTPNAGSIIENGRNGLLVPYGDAEALYQSLHTLITEPECRSMLALQALQDIQHFTWDAYGEKLAALLKETVYETTYA